MVADPRLQRLAHLGRVAHPVRIRRDRGATVEVALAADHDHVPLRDDLRHEPSVALAGHAQATALSHRVVRDARMLPGDRAVRPLDRPRHADDAALLEDLTVIAARHETDVHAVRLLCEGEARLACHSARLRLRHPAQREHRAPQRLLPQRVQDVGLVLVVVHGAMQPLHVAVAHDLRVVPRREAVDAHRQRALEQRVELHVLVAVQARVRRLPARIRVHELAEDVALELALHVQHVVRDADRLRSRACVADVLDAAAGAARPQRRVVGLRVEAQRHADDVVPLPMQQRGRHGRVHPTRHRHQDALAHVLQCTRAVGSDGGEGGIRTHE